LDVVEEYEPVLGDELEQQAVPGRDPGRSVFHALKSV
jgi:hypothetical protein